MGDTGLLTSKVWIHMEKKTQGGKLGAWFEADDL